MSQLPPGQRVAEHRRFGLPAFAGPAPQPPRRPVLTISGAVRRPAQPRLADLVAHGDRREQASDLHCVTTWTAPGLRWEGVPFAAIHERLAADVGIAGRVRWVAFVGLDGFRCCLRLDDALAGDVLIADRLDGRALTPELGAPARLIAPAHYGYKSVRHLCGIEYLPYYEAGPSGWKAHPRGRVAREERSRFLPGPVWRGVWRSALPWVRRLYGRRPR